MPCARGGLGRFGACARYPERALEIPHLLGEDVTRSREGVTLRFPPARTA
jgi:hypothetical protein